MKYLHPVAFIPNELIRDTQVHFSTKRIAVVLLHLAGRKGRAVKVSYAELARICRCSTTTAQQAVAELLNAGYIAKRRCYRYSPEQGHLVYDCNSYVWLRRNSGYTMVRREILDYVLTPAAFCNLLYLYLCSGRSGRAFPSLQRLAGRLKQQLNIDQPMAKSTVCKALCALRKHQALVRHHCRTKRCCYAANSYYMTDMVVSDGRKSSDKGSPISDKPIISNQITRDYTQRDVKQEVENPSSWPLPNWLDSPYWFDGTGVKISATERQITAG